MASRCLPDAGAESTAPEDDPREALYSLADGALRALADETDASGTLAGFPPNSANFFSSASSSSAFAARHLSLGAPPGWRAASDAPRERVAATLPETLRAASGGGGVGHHGFGAPGRRYRGTRPVFFDVDASSSASSDAYAFPRGGRRSGRARRGGGGAGDGPRDGGGAPLPPSKCKALLRALVAAVSRGTRADQSRGDRSRRFAGGIGPGGGGGGGGAYPGLGAVRFDEETCLDAASRANLYAALVSLLRYARPASGPNPARVPASVLALAEDAANTFAAETGPGTSDGSPGDRGEGSAQGARAEASAFGSAFGRGTGTGGGVPGSGIDVSPRRGVSESNPFGGEGESSAAARFAREASAAASAAARARDELDAGAAATPVATRPGSSRSSRDVVDAGPPTRGAPSRSRRSRRSSTSPRATPAGAATRAKARARAAAAASRAATAERRRASARSGRAAAARDIGMTGSLRGRWRRLPRALSARRSRTPASSARASRRSSGWRSPTSSCPRRGRATRWLRRAPR